MESIGSDHSCSHPSYTTESLLRNQRVTCQQVALHPASTPSMRQPCVSQITWPTGKTGWTRLRQQTGVRRSCSGCLASGFPSLINTCSQLSQIVFLLWQMTSVTWHSLLRDKNWSYNPSGKESLSKKGLFWPFFWVHWTCNTTPVWKHTWEALLWTVSNHRAFNGAVVQGLCASSASPEHTHLTQLYTHPTGSSPSHLSPELI